MQARSRFAIAKATGILTCYHLLLPWRVVRQATCSTDTSVTPAACLRSTTISTTTGMDSVQAQRCWAGGTTCVLGATAFDAGGFTRPNNCECDAALSQEVLPSELGVHEAPPYVVQDQS